MSEYQNKKIAVAIVEDDPMVRRITEEFLEKVEGYSCQATYSGIPEAMEGIRKNQPELVLLDLFFPKGSGMDLLKWIRKSELDMDVILITADHSATSIEQAMRYGAAGYLVKPFRFNRFEEALKKYYNMKAELIKGEITNQTIIDNLMNWSKSSDIEKSSLETTSNSYVSDREDRNPTYDKLLAYLKENKYENFTASMLGDKLGVSRITARRYLDQMEKEGVIELQMLYGNVGRPQNYYHYKGDKNEG